MKLFISPRFNGVDKGYHGGIRRVIDNQRKYLDKYIVDDYRDADVVAIHAGSLVPLRSDQTVISHCHGLYWNKYKWDDSPGYNDINRAVIESMRLADAITAPTEWVANTVRRGMYAPCTVIGHAVDKEWIPSHNNMSKNYVLWNKSRIDSVCNPAPAYRVAEMLPYVDFHLTVGHAHSANITITGLTPYADHKPVQEAGVYLATAQETFGIGILEALACGVPVAGWDWGGQAELVTHKVTGWLAREGDYESLAEGIEWCLANRERISTNCVESTKNFTWEEVCKTYETFYQERLAEKRHGVSVIIRNYNLAKYLPDAIMSVVDQLNQDDDEIIVLDDCSTDDSKDVFDSLDLPEVDINWVRTPSNLHLAGALNFGTSYSHGEYIVQLDADNMLAPGSIKMMQNALDADRNIDIVYGRVKFVRPDGYTPDADVSGREDGVSSWPPALFDINKQLGHRNQIPCTTMYRRKVWERIGPYRTRCRVAEDADFWCRATSLGFRPKLITDAPTLIYRNRPGTLSQTSADWAWEKWHNSNNLAAVGNYKPSAFTYEPILVSVIIPVGPGHELLLQDALDSLFYQTMRNWECIVINDTGKPLPWVPPWVRLIENKETLGTSLSRNIGLAHINGRTWLPLDADDYLAPTALEKMLYTYTRYGGYVYSDFVNIDSVGGASVTQTPNKSCSAINHELPHLVTGLYPRNDLRFDTHLELAEDWDFAVQMTNAGYCGTRVPEPLVYYRRSSGTRRIEFTDSHRLALKEKWEGVIVGCGCKKGTSNNAPDYSASGMLNQAQNDLSVTGILEPANSQQMTLIEYIGEEPKKYFTGKVTHQIYAFGVMAIHKLKYVYNEDVSGFIDDRPDIFRLYIGDGVLAS